MFGGWILCALTVLAAALPVPLRAAAPEVLLAEVAPADIEPSAYWVSEKLDGVRAVWNGKTLHFRGGSEVRAPSWFVAGLPPVPLDGELWLGRGSFDRLSGIVRQQVPDEEAWRAVRYMVFELPGAAGDFSARLRALEDVVAAQASPFLAVVPQHRVRDRRALQRLLDVTLAAGGEGLMLHRADAAYLAGRSPALLKLKPWLDDEARVLAHLPGKGRHRGRLGALLVERADGQRFRLGSGLSDAEREQPPPLGSVVSFRYRSLTPAGLPRFPIYWRLRSDADLQTMPGSIAGTSSSSP